MQQRRRLIRWAVLLVVFGLAALYLAASWIAYDVGSLPPAQHAPVFPQRAYQEITFPARGQSYRVQAFLQRGQSGRPALINVHGYRSTRYSRPVLDRSDALNALGYTVITLDLSDNGGATIGNGRISFGYSEKWDVLGAVDVLITLGFTAGNIGLVGESMGAATILLSAAEDSRLRAVWADSSFARADVVLMEQAHTGGIPGFVVPGGLFIGALRTGDRVWEAAPLDMGGKLHNAGQAVYLLTCEQDPLVWPHHSRDLLDAYRRSGVDVTLWVIACQTHVGGLSVARDEYLTRLDQFFRKKLRQV